VEAPIVDRPTPTTWRRRRLGQSPLPSDENAESRPARRSLFSPTSRPTPLRDVSNTAYRRCASDTVADSARLQPTRRLTKTQSMSTAVLSAVTDNDDDHRLVGDFTRPLCLPLVSDAKHCDLNTISHHTVWSVRPVPRRPQQWKRKNMNDVLLRNRQSLHKFTKLCLWSSWFLACHGCGHHGHCLWPWAPWGVMSWFVAVIVEPLQDCYSKFKMWYFSCVKVYVHSSFVFILLRPGLGIMFLPVCPFIRPCILKRCLPISPNPHSRKVRIRDLD